MGHAELVLGGAAGTVLMAPPFCHDYKIEICLFSVSVNELYLPGRK